MSFPAALQSAVFYFLACTPCAQARHRQKSKAQAKKDRAEKADLEARQPGLYRHPSPFKTNEYWQGEISMGPSLPKKPNSKNSSARRLTNNSAGRAESAASISEPGTNMGDSRTNMGDSTLVIPEDQVVPDDWNRKAGYQREDEELWGQWHSHRLMDAFSKARDSAGRLIESTLGLEKEVTEQERRNFYVSTQTNPPVNDYHPPVVSNKAPHRDAHRWMLQPPPPAKVMEGKVPVSRATSSGSKSSARTLTADELPLSRMMQERQVKERLMKGESPTQSDLSDPFVMNRPNRSLSFPRSYSYSISIHGSDDSIDQIPDRRVKGRLRARAAPPGAESDNSDGDNWLGDSPTRSASSTQDRPPPGPVMHAAQRPNLDTIRSESFLKSQRSTRNSRSRRTAKKRALAGVASPVGDDTD